MVSFIVVTYQRNREAVAAVESILKQKGELEIILIDNNPKSDLQKLMPSDHRIRMFPQHVNRGFIWARNFAFKIAKGEVLFFLDDDAELEWEGSTEYIERIFQEHPEAGCLAFKILNYYTRKIVPKEFPHNKVSLHSSYFWAGYYVGAAHAIRRSVFNQVGELLDVGYGGEELDYSFRLIQRGYKILYVPDITVLHKAAPTGRHSYNKNFYYLQRNRLWITARHLPLIYFIINNLLWSTVWLCRAIKSRAIRFYLKGTLEGVQLVKHVIINREREVLSRDAMAYLKRNGGRLWF